MEIAGPASGSPSAAPVSGGALSGEGGRCGACSKGRSTATISKRSPSFAGTAPSSRSTAWAVVPQI